MGASNKIDFEVNNLTDLMTEIGNCQNKMNNGLYNSLCVSLKNINNENEKQKSDIIWKITFTEKDELYTSEFPNSSIVVNRNSSKTMYLKEKKISTENIAGAIFIGDEDIYKYLFVDGEYPVVESPTSRRLCEIAYGRVFTHTIDNSTLKEEDGKDVKTYLHTKAFCILMSERVS